MGPRDLERYKRPLLAKLEELSATRTEVKSPVVAAGGLEVRIRRGTFGACGVCEQPISKARLEAALWTRHCRDCKEQGHP